MSDENTTTVKAEIEVDHQHGPIVRVTINSVSVAVYLMSETAVINTPTGPYGLEVIGSWPTFRRVCQEVFA
jgi:hypothetical protein